MLTLSKEELQIFKYLGLSISPGVNTERKSTHRL